MKKHIILISFVVIALSSFSQHIFTGNIEGYSGRSLNVCSQFGDESKLIEIIETGYDGSFTYPLIDHEFGLYRIYFDTQDYFDIVYKDENINIYTKIENPQYNMIVSQSEETKQLYSYLVSNYISDYKIDVLNQLLEIYPDGKFRNKALKELKKEVTYKSKSLEKVIKQNPDSFTGKYLTFMRVITPPSKMNDYEKKQYIKERYFETYVMDDLELLNSNAYNEVVLNYFKLFKSNNPDTYYDAGKTILEDVFFGEPKIFNFVFEYILTGFESLSLDEPAAKLSLEYGDVCSDVDGSLKMRIKSNTELSVGKKAPDFTAQTFLGEEYTLSKMEKKYTLLIFWASWCDHCNITMPRLAAAGSVFREADMEIVAVSIDSEKDDLVEYLEANALPWKVLAEYKGWDGEIIIDYAIFATPTMMVIDNELNIVAKPFNEEKLYDVLEDIIVNKR